MATKQTKKAKAKEERLEDILWSCRNHLRGKADMSDKRDVLLTLVFLKFMSDRFEEQQEKIRARYPGSKLAEIQLRKPAAYGQDSVIFLRARFGEKDLIGRVYEYYLQAFSINADKEEGELLARQGENAVRLKAAFEKLGGKVSHGVTETRRKVK